MAPVAPSMVSFLEDAPNPANVRQMQYYINGQWEAANTTDITPVINPATEEILAHTPMGSAADVDRAVAAAKAAFPAWRETPVMDRVQILFKLKTLLEANSDELARICTLENGKTLAESKGDLRRGIQMVETACGMPSLMMGKKSEDIAAGIDSEAVKRPMGVFGAITPFNFPPMVPLWFWPFAIAAGNTFVLKPSERVPLCPTRIMELTAEAGLPAGVLNIVHGGKPVVDRLCTHPDIQGISFVGSTPVAKHVYQTASSVGKRVQALGGAKNFMVVLPDAPMGLALRTIVESCTGCAGQRCLAGSVILVVGDVYDQVKAGIVSAVQDITVGSGLDPKTQVGPVISAASKERITGLISEAEGQGATVLVDGRSRYADQKGYFVGPTVIEGVKPDHRIAQEEVFGPVILLAKVNSMQEAVQWINSSPYGNTASLFTASGGAAREFSYRVDPAMIGINIGVPAPMAFFSFGGAKASFFGDLKAHGAMGVDFYTDSRVTIHRWVKESSIW